MRQDARYPLESEQWRAIQLCGGCAQAVATQLMKDVRCYESDQQVSVKVAATLRP
jgi:hypothetical protein